MHPKQKFTWTSGIKMGRISSPKTVDIISKPAALHFRKFQELIMSSSSCICHTELTSKCFKLRKKHPCCKWFGTFPARPIPPKKSITRRKVRLHQHIESDLQTSSSSAPSAPCMREWWNLGLISCKTVWPCKPPVPHSTWRQTEKKGAIVADRIGERKSSSYLFPIWCIVIVLQWNNKIQLATILLIQCQKKPKTTCHQQ
jgi:hypothetical protein